jgi:hypothetical protein
MKSNKLILAALMLTVLFACCFPPYVQAADSKSGKSVPQWSVQVDQIDPGEVNLEPAFRVAIYENLIVELTKTKRFQQVFRTGDHHASEVPNLLILKTTVQKYSPGSETKRAVTTVSGATKLNVRSQLCNSDGKVILEKVVDGNVRFFGGNLRATHNLAHNIATQIKESTLPEAKPATTAGRVEPAIEVSGVL